MRPLLLQVPFEVEAAGTDAAAADTSLLALVRQPYGTSALEAARACLRRGLWSMKGNLGMHLGRLFQMVLLAFIVGTLFLQEGKGLQTGPGGASDVSSSITSANNFLGVLFFTAITL